MYKATELIDMFDVRPNSIYQQIVCGNLNAFKIDQRKWGVTDINLFNFLVENPKYHWRVQENAKKGNTSAQKCMEMMERLHSDRCPIYSRDEILDLLNKSVGWYKYRQGKGQFPACYISQKEFVDYLAQDRKTRDELTNVKYSKMKYDILSALQAKGVKL